MPPFFISEMSIMGLDYQKCQTIIIVVFDNIIVPIAKDKSAFAVYL